MKHLNSETPQTPAQQRQVSVRSTVPRKADGRQAAHEAAAFGRFDVQGKCNWYDSMKKAALKRSASKGICTSGVVYAALASA